MAAITRTLKCASVTLATRRFAHSVAAVSGEKLKMSHVRGPTEPALITQTLGDLFESQAQKYTSKELMYFREEKLRLDWTESSYRVASLATGLLKLGYQKGDRLGVWMPSYSEWTLMQLACTRIGVILVNLNPSYRSHELEHAINLVGCKGILLTQSYRSDKYLDILSPLVPELQAGTFGEATNLNLQKLPSLKHIIMRDNPKVPGILPFEDLLLTPKHDEVNKIASGLNCNEVINIQFTSGTTGLPKAAALSHLTIVNNGYFAGGRMRFTEVDKVCVPVPLYHCFGTVLGNILAISKGGSLVFPAPAFNAEATMMSVAEERCTALHGVPTMMIAVLEHPRFKEVDVSCLRTGIMAGASCAPELMRRVMNDLHMRDVVIGYGMTETGPLSFQTDVNDTVEARCETVGRILPHTECKVTDANNKVLPVGEKGELKTKGYLVMKGYWAQADKTKQTIDDDGFVSSGDQATMDEDGYLRVVGRLKDIIIRGGENIAPKEVEEFLFTHPGVADVQVVGTPDAKYGEQVACFIIPRPGYENCEDFTPEGLKKYCDGRISRFKVPTYVWAVKSYPLTVTGKVQKNKLRDLAAQMTQEANAQAA